MTASIAAGHRFDRGAWSRLLVLCSAILFEGMSLSGINVQLAQIERDLDLRPDQLQLVAGTFLIAYAGCLLVGGRCADLWGAGRVFLGGMALFGVGSLVGGLAQDVLQAVGGRAVQGVGAAVTAPAAVALIADVFPEGSARNRAMGVFSAMGAVGFSLGVVVGGLLTAWFGWRWAFLLYLPLSAAVLVAGRGLLEQTRPRQPGEVGWRSALLAPTALVAIVYAVGRVGTAPLVETLAVVGGGLVVLGGFLAIQARSTDPLLPLGLLANPRISAGAVGLGGAFAGIAGAMFLVATALQNDQGYSPFAAGLVFLPQGIAVGVLSTRATRLAGRWPTSRLLMTGLGVLVAGQLLYVRSATDGYADRLLPAAILVGCGIAATYPAAYLLTTAAAPSGQQGVAAGLLTTFQQTGSAVGIATVTAVQVADGGTTVLPGLWTAVGLTLLTLVASAGILRFRPLATSRADPVTVGALAGDDLGVTGAQHR